MGAVTNKYRGGEGLDVRVIYSGGTIAINGDYVGFDVDQSIDLIDVTSGTDADKGYIAGIKDGSAKLKYFDTGNSGTPAGTVIASAMTIGNRGTLIYSPKGTATGNPKRGWEYLVKSFKESYPNDDKVEFEVEFQKTGPVLYAPGVTW